METKLVPLQLSDEQAQKVAEAQLNRICDLHGWKRSDYPADLAKSMLGTYASEAKKRYAEAINMLAI